MTDITVIRANMIGANGCAPEDGGLEETTRLVARWQSFAG
jgi:hypothetical protein